MHYALLYYSDYEIWLTTLSILPLMTYVEWILVTFFSLTVLMIGVIPAPLISYPLYIINIMALFSTQTCFSYFSVLPSKAVEKAPTFDPSVSRLYNCSKMKRFLWQFLTSFSINVPCFLSLLLSL